MITSLINNQEKMNTKNEKKKKKKERREITSEDDGRGSSQNPEEGRINWADLIGELVRIRHD